MDGKRSLDTMGRYIKRFLVLVGGLSLAASIFLIGAGLGPSGGFLKGFTVSGLPSAGVVGRMAILTDGGGKGSLVIDDGTNWTCEQEKSQNIYIVTCPPYNAVGNGAIDDTAAIQAAIDAAEANFGGIVYFPRGDFDLTSGITIEQDGVNLIGSGDDATWLHCAFAAGNCIVIGGVAGNTDRVAIKDMTISDGGVTRTSGSHLFYDRARYATVDRVRIVQAYTGVRIGTSTNPAPATIGIRFTNCRIDSSAHAIIFVSTSGFWISDCHINGNGSTTSQAFSFDSTSELNESIYIRDVIVESHAWGLYVTPTANTVANILITSLVLDNMDEDAFYLVPSSTGAISNILISNCWVSGTSGSGGSRFISIAAPSGTNTNNTIVNGCKASQLRREGVRITGTPLNIVITNNLIESGTSAAHHGMEIVGGDDLVINGNRITTNTSASCIWIGSTVTDFVVTGNRCVQGITNNAGTGADKIVDHNSIG